MDYLGLLEGKQWVAISEDFNYVRATEDFVGLKLFPMFRTENMKVAIADLVKGGDVPVMAVVHALDTEAKIGDRPDFKEINFELLLVKEKLDQGEALRKKIKDMGMSNEEKAIIEAVYNDASNLISRVLTRFEVMADELLSTGKISINENNVSKVIDYGMPEENFLTVSSWSNANHDILGDLVKIRRVSKNKIVRALTSDKVMGYILGNTKIAQIAGEQGAYLTEDWAKAYIKGIVGIEFVVVDGTYKLSAQSTQEYNFFDEDTITFLTTMGTLGYTFVTSTPAEDCQLVNAVVTTGFVAVDQWLGNDPKTVWTEASGLGLPVPQNIKGIFICKVGA